MTALAHRPGAHMGTSPTVILARGESLAASTTDARSSEASMSSRKAHKPLSSFMQGKLRKTRQERPLNEDSDRKLSRPAADLEGSHNASAFPTPSLRSGSNFLMESKSSAAPDETQSPVRGSSKQLLYDPDFDRSNNQYASSEIHKTALEPSNASKALRIRTRRDPVDLEDLGQRRNKDSKDSLQSEESVKAPSRSSKEGRHRRRRAEHTRRKDDVAESPLDDRPGPSRHTSRHLFDPRSDDPVRFSHSRTSLQEPRKMADAISIASTISFGGSSVQSHATRESLLSQPHVARRISDLKATYRDILQLENQIRKLHDEADRSSEPQGRISASGLETNAIRWHDMITKHSELGDLHYSFLQLAFDPRNEPAAKLHALPHKYDIPTRMWEIAFQKLLARMRRHVVRTQDSQGAVNGEDFDLFVDFIQHAYRFYTQLFEDATCRPFRSAWIEQLGDLARLRSSFVPPDRDTKESSQSPTHDNLSHEKQVERPPSDTASIGQAAIDSWDVEEREQWQETAISWYLRGLADCPDSGRLHYNLSLLTGQDLLLRLYHCCKSLSVLQPFNISEDAVRTLLQRQPDARQKSSNFGWTSLLTKLWMKESTADCVANARELLQGSQRESFGDLEEALTASVLVMICSCSPLSASPDNTSPRNSKRAEHDHPQAILMAADAKDEAPKLVPFAESVSATTSGEREARVAAVAIVSLLLSAVVQRAGSSTRVPPVISIISTWLYYCSKTASLDDLLRASIPWRQFADDLKRAGNAFDADKIVNTKPFVEPLPEDWLQRGLDWSSSGDAYPKHFWRPSRHAETRPHFEDDGAIRHEGDAIGVLARANDSSSNSSTDQARKARLLACIAALEVYLARHGDRPPSRTKQVQALSERFDSTYI